MTSILPSWRDAAGRSRTGRRCRALAPVVALVAVTIALVLPAEPVAAQLTDKTFQYDCILPIVGKQEIPITLRVTTPDSITVGDQVTANTEVGVAVPANVQAAMPIVGATSADLDSTLHTTWSGAISAAVDGTLSVRKSAPSGGSWAISGTASYPPVLASAAGAVSVTVGVIDLVLTLRKADGSLTGLKVVNTTCTLRRGQDALLMTVNVAPAAGPAPAPSPAPSPSAQPPDSTAPTPASDAPSSTTATTSRPSGATTTSTSQASAAAPTGSTTTTTLSETDATVADYGGLLDQYFSLGASASLNRVGAEVPFQTGRFVSLLNLQNGLFFGEFKLPPSQVRFKLFGVMPVVADVRFEQIDPAYGKIDNGVVTAAAKVRIGIGTVRLGRLTLSAGTSCTSSAPIDLPLASGPNFNPLAGGKVSGAFAIPSFTDCGLVGALADSVISGPGNRLTLDLTPTQK